MFRTIAVSATRRAVVTSTAGIRRTPIVPCIGAVAPKNFTTLVRNHELSLRPARPIGSLIQPSIAPRLLDAVQACPQLQTQPCRTVIKFSLRKGKRKTVKAVLKRFKRLDWGGWIRTISGRHKKLWRKKANRKRRLRQHVLVNATQSTLLDKMVTKYWKRPRYYVNDPYAPYHSREEFVHTRRRPLA